MSDKDYRDSDNSINNERRQAAAANLEKRKQQLRDEKRSGLRRSRSPRRPVNSTATRPVGRRRRRQNRLKLFVLAGLIIIFCLLAMIACTSKVRTALRAERAAREAAEEEAGEVVIGLKGSQTQLVLQGDPYIENGAFAIDTASGAIPESKIRIRGDVDTSEPGDYTVKYTARGTNGKATAERTVRVLTEEEYGTKAGNVPVLMYHWVYTDSDVPDDLDGNWILDTALEEQLAWLKENEFYYPGWKELRAWVDDEISMPAKCAVMTFDDGKEGFLKYGIPLLEKYEIPATSFMIGWDRNNGADKVKQYASPYIDYESHTYAMHQKAEPEVNGHKGIMATMSKEEIMEDLAQAAALTGNNDALAYPYGDYTDEMLDAVREQGITCAVTVEYDRVRKGMDPAKLPRVRVLGDESFQIWKDSVY